jgi:hypothetical protein
MGLIDHPLDYARIAEQHRHALRKHRRFTQRPQTDFRSDAGGIAHGEAENGSGFHHVE